MTLVNESRNGATEVEAEVEVEVEVEGETTNLNISTHLSLMKSLNSPLALSSSLIKLITMAASPPPLR